MGKWDINYNDISRVNLFRVRQQLKDIDRELLNSDLSPIQKDELESIKVDLQDCYSYIIDMRNERSE